MVYVELTAVSVVGPGKSRMKIDGKALLQTVDARTGGVEH